MGFGEVTPVRPASRLQPTPTSPAMLSRATCGHRGHGRSREPVLQRASGCFRAWYHFTILHDSGQGSCVFVLHKACNFCSPPRMQAHPDLLGDP